MSSYTTSLLCIVGFVVVVVLAFLANAIRIIPEYQRLVVFRLGRCIGEKGPGLVILIPFVDRAVKVDLREAVREIPYLDRFLVVLQGSQPNRFCDPGREF